MEMRVLIARTRDCVEAMAENTRYVLHEVGSLDLEPALRDDVVSTFQALSNTLEFDARGELRAMAEKLDPDSDEEYSNRDPAVNGGLILSWVGSDLKAMNMLIDRLPDGDVGPATAALRVLLFESGGNILKAYAEMRRTIAEMTPSGAP